MHSHGFPWHKRRREFKYRIAYTYIIGAAFWNFVGAGVFGGGTPLPQASPAAE